MTLFEYVRQVRAHRRRVANYWFDAYLRSGGEYSHPIEMTLRIHDSEKWLFLPLLYWFRCGRGNRDTARKVYDLMNRVGDWHWRFQVALLGFRRCESSYARTVERVIDCLDRHTDPVARVELGDGGPPLRSFLSEEEMTLARKIALGAGIELVE